MKPESEINSLFQSLIERSKQDRRLLNSLKSFAVKSQSYELAAKLKDLERIHFPDTKEVSDLKIRAEFVKKCFSIIDIPITEKTAMTVDLVMNMINDKMDEANLKDLAKISAYVENIYPEL